MKPRLLALTELDRFPDPAAALAPLCRRARPGSVAVVLRDRQAALSVRLSWGRALRGLTAATGQVFLVSDRVDLALELGADGVHLPAGGLWPSQVQQLFPEAVISRAHHDLSDLPLAEVRSLDLLLVSPAFAERKGRPALGEAGLARRVSALRLLAPNAQILALGGILASSVTEAFEAGADGVAAIGAAHDEAEQRALVQQLGIGRLRG